MIELDEPHSNEGLDGKVSIMRVHLLYAGIIAAALATCANPGATQTMNIPNRNVPTSDVSPISVQSCDVDAMAGSNPLLAKTGQLTIAFANDGSIIADLVRFRVTFVGHEAMVRDTGQFAPGVTIRHHFRDTAGYYGSPLFGASPRCTVESVHFIDGTTWLTRGQVAANDEATGLPSSATPTGGSSTTGTVAQCSTSSALISYRKSFGNENSGSVILADGQRFVIPLEAMGAEAFSAAARLRDPIEVCERVPGRLPSEIGGHGRFLYDKRTGNRVALYDPEASGPAPIATP